MSYISSASAWSPNPPVCRHPSSPAGSSALPLRMVRPIAFQNIVALYAQLPLLVPPVNVLLLLHPQRVPVRCPHMGSRLGHRARPQMCAATTSSSSCSGRRRFHAGSTIYRNIRSLICALTCAVMMARAIKHQHSQRPSLRPARAFQTCRPRANPSKTLGGGYSST